MASEEVVREFVKASRRSQRRPCKVALAIDRLKPADQKKAREGLQLLADGHPDVTVGGVMTWFKANHDIDVPNPSVVSHSHGNCACADDD